MCHGWLYTAYITEIHQELHLDILLLFLVTPKHQSYGQ